jgi:hypothetical protein
MCLKTTACGKDSAAVLAIIGFLNNDEKRVHLSQWVALQACPEQNLT